MKIVTVVGARPQFVKAATVSAAIAQHNKQSAALEEVLVHTGQHYDQNMSQIFFDQLRVPRPKYNLAVGSGSHGAMTGKMLAAVEQILLDERPDWLLIYGDTNSTLAGALAAAKVHIPVCHVEAGLRSFDKRMPEEVNRVLTDHVSRLLLCPTHAAIQNLGREGVTRGVHHVGDVMYDAALVFAKVAAERSNVMARHRLTSKQFLLATVHRAENTDDPARLEHILKALCRLARPECPLLLPLHPRTRTTIKTHGFDQLVDGNPAVLVTEPVPFLDMIVLEQHAKLILTDSGGVQKEAYFHGVPCVTLRDETEWVETVAAGWNQLAGADPARIELAAAAAKPGRVIAEYGDGNAASKVVGLLLAGASVAMPNAASPRDLKKTLWELIRFGSVGGSTALMYFVLVWLLAKLLTMPMWAIATLASGPPLLTAYILHRSFTFNSKKQHKSGGPRFLVVQLTALVLNSVAIWLGVDLGHLPFVPVQLGAIAVQVLFTYTSQKYFVFS